MEILSILFPLDQKPKPSNQGLSLEQAFQQNVCAMAQRISYLRCRLQFWTEILDFKDSYKKVLRHGGAWQYHPFYYTMNIKEHLMRNLFQMKIIPRCHNLFSRRTLK